jgi:hypothetical protein
MKVCVNGKYEEMDLPTPEIPNIAVIAELKQCLADTDYISCKIAEGAATREEYADIITKRQEWRDEINRLKTTEE